MKTKSLNYLIILVLALCSCEDTELGEPVSRNHFYKLYGTYHWEFPNSVIETNDGGLIWVGYNSQIKENDQTDAEFNAMPYICKVQPDGMVEWHIYNMANYQKSIAHDVKLINQNSEILVSISQKITENSFLLHLLPVSLSGDMDTTLSAEINTNRVISANIVVRDDDSVRIIAQTENIEGDIASTSIHIFKINAQNKLEKTYDYKFTDWLPGKMEAAYLADDQIILASTSSDDESGGSETNVRVLNVVDQSILWEEQYGFQGISETCSELKIIGNEIVIAGNLIESDSTHIQVLTIDAATQQGGFVKYATNNITNPICNSFDINSNNSYVFTGSVVTGLERSDIFFYEASKTGVEINCLTFGSNGEEAGENIGRKVIAIDNTEDYYLLGQLEPITNTDVVIFKLDKNGSYLD